MNRGRIAVTGAVAILLASGFAPLAYSQGSDGKYKVERANSWLLAITDKTGVLSFAAHKHAVLASRWSAALNVDPADPQKSKARVTIPVLALVIDSNDARQRAGLGSGPSADDVRTIQQRMPSAEVLDARRYPEIQFTTTRIDKNGADQLRIMGKFQLHGHSQMVSIPARYQREGGGRFRLNGEFVIRQSDFGIKPETVAGGMVKVKDEVTIQFQVTIVPGDE